MVGFIFHIALSAGQDGGVGFTKVVLDSRFVAESAIVGDVDRDGRVDILAGNLWFRAPDWTPHEIAPPIQIDPRTQWSNCFLSWADDVNRDGWLDQIVIGMPGEKAVWRENPKGEKGPWKEHLISTTAGNESAFYGKLADDGPNVLVMGVDDTHMAWLEPASDPTKPWTRHLIGGPNAPGAPRYSHGLGVFDLNGDGRRDIVVRDGWYSGPSDPRQVPWTFTKADLGPDCAQMRGHDVNGDGRTDILSTSAHARGVWWHEAQADGTFRRHLIDETVSVTHAANLATLGTAKALNLITGKRKWGHPPGVDPGSEEAHWVVRYELESTSAGPRWTRHIIDEDSGVGTQFSVEDVTGDGRADIVAANKNGVFLFVQTGGK